VVPEDGVNTLEGATTKALWRDRLAQRVKNADNKIVNWKFIKKSIGSFYE
jgi:hypothetical protein